MNRLKSLAYLLIIIIFQISFINQGILFNFYPDMILVYLVFIFHRETKNLSIFLAIIAGLIYDTLFSKILGLNIILYLLICFIILKLRNYIFSENIKNAIIFILSSKIIYLFMKEIIYFFKLNIFSLNSIISNLFSIETLFEIIIYYLVSQYYFLYKNKGELM